MLFVRTTISTSIKQYSTLFRWGTVRVQGLADGLNCQLDSFLYIQTVAELLLKVRVSVCLAATLQPQMKPGWRVQFKTRKLLEPRKLEDGQTITETVDEVSWSGGPLPNDHYDTFGLRMKLPDAAGQTLWFPVIQECRKGGRSWVGIPKPGMNQSEYKNSAPFVRIVPKAP